jgi:accessory gene regulator B
VIIIKSIFLNNCISLIKHYNKDYSQKEIDKIRYGLEGVYLTITKAIIFILASSYFGILKEFFILTIMFSIIRMFAFGMHASKSYICLILSGSVFLTFSYFANIIFINDIIKILILSLCFILFFIYAPADTHKRPLINVTKRKNYKFMSLMIVFLYSLLSFFFKERFMQNCLIFSLIMEVIMILPISYKLFGLPYNNYKRYVKKVN